jgi:hypothetical protein
MRRRRHARAGRRNGGGEQSSAESFDEAGLGRVTCRGEGEWAGGKAEVVEDGADDARGGDVGQHAPGIPFHHGQPPAFEPRYVIPVEDGARRRAPPVAGNAGRPEFSRQHPPDDRPPRAASSRDALPRRPQAEQRLLLLAQSKRPAWPESAAMSQPSVQVIQCVD